jgi:hypothetical protein
MGLVDGRWAAGRWVSGGRSVRGGRSICGEFGGKGAEAVQAGVAEAADQGGADDGAVGEAGHGGGLLGVRDTDAGADGQVGVGTDPADQLLDAGGQGGAQAGHPE